MSPTCLLLSKSKTRDVLFHGVHISLQTKETQAKIQVIQMINKAPKPNVQNILYSYGTPKRLFIYTRDRTNNKIVGRGGGLEDNRRISTDLCAFTLDARFEQLFDDATHSVRLALDVAAINPQCSY